MSEVAIVGPDAPSQPEVEAVRILVQRLLRAGVAAATADAPPPDGSHVIVGTPSSSALVRAAVDRGDLDLSAAGREGYVLARAGDAVFLAANEAPAVVFAVGRLLHEGWPAAFDVIASAPALPIRNIYFADHMGNWYSHAPEDEVLEYLDEMALWGYNELMTCVAVKQGETFVDAVERVRRLEEAARRLGMTAGPVVQSNTSYVGPAPEHRATPVPIAAPYDVCASQPGSADFLVGDKRDYLALMAPFDYICLWPYDGGGCACDACSPWGKTFLELSERIAREALPGRPEVWVSAWFFEKWAAGEDDALFSALSRSPDWFSRVVAGAEEARRWVERGRSVPEQYPVALFPDISMFDGIPWGGRGANPAFRRFAAELRDTRRLSQGAIVYSEGRYDDANKILWAALLWDPDRPELDIAIEYCRTYFGDAAASGGAALLLEIEEGMEMLPDPERWRRGTFHPEWDEHAASVEALLEPGVVTSWRWQLVRAKTRIEAGCAAVAHAASHDARSQAIDDLRQVYEHVRDVLNLHDPERSLPTWFWAPLEEAFAFVPGVAPATS